MHDLGDALLRSGFAEPVMDTERLTVTYADSKTLIAELRNTASTNVALGRRPGLMDRAAAKRFEDSLSTAKKDGLYPVTLEVVYGHAWTVESSRKRTSGETVVPLANLRRPPRN